MKIVSSPSFQCGVSDVTGFISFEFSRRGTVGGDGFALGDMTIAVGELRYSSAGRVPDQSMMIYLAIVDLIWGLCDLAVKGRGVFEFVGADSSFSVVFEAKKTQLTLRAGRVRLGTVPTLMAVRALSDGVDVFLASSENQLSPADSVYEDLQAARRKLQEVLALPGNHGGGGGSGRASRPPRK